MKKIKLYILLILFVSQASMPVVGQENILYFLSNTPQANYLNPANITDQSKVVVDLPLLSGLDFSINNSFSFHDLISKENGVAVINLDEFNSKIPKKNYLSENFMLPLFDFQLRLKNRSFSLGVFENQLTRGGFDKNLTRLINEGNYPWLGSSFNTNLDFNFLHFREYSLGYSQSFSKKLTLGTRVKLLTGMSIADVRRLNLGIETGSNMEYLTVHATGEYTTNLPFDISEGTTDISIIDYFKNTSNLGFAFDFGAKYKLLPNLDLSASVINLGFINWKSTPSTLSHSGSFTWNGFDLSNIQNENGFNEEPYLEPFQSLIDSATEILNFTETNAPFNSSIPTNVFFAANYQVSPFFNAGLVERMMIYDRQFSNALTLSGNLKLGNIFSLSAGYSIIDNSFNNLSLGTALKLGPFQFYCLTDNILALNILDSQNFNVRFGMNLMFGKLKTSEQ